MKRTRRLGILSLVVLAVIIVCTGCEPRKIRQTEPISVPVAAPEPVPVPEPPQPVITEPKVEPTPEPPPPTPTPKAKPPETSYFVHTVKWRGESLSTIAAWYTGTIKNWRALSEANPQVTDPNKLPIGDKIRIPSKMLRTRETMPQGFAESYAKPPKQSGTGATGKNAEPAP